jgi:hypothetical protein
MATELDKFLSAEAAVVKLLAETERLHAETKGYADARGSLTQVRNDLVSFLEASRSLSERAQAAIAGLKEIGTPEILERMQVFRTDLKDGMDSVQTAVVHAGEGLRKHSAAAQEALQTQSGMAHEDLRKGLDAAMRTTQVALQKALTEQLGQAATAHSAAVTTLATQLDAMSLAAHRRHRTTVGLVLFVIVLLVAVVALSLFSLRQSLGL